MTRKFSRGAAVLAGAAVLSMVATPAMARPRGWGAAGAVAGAIAIMTESMVAMCWPES